MNSMTAANLDHFYEYGDVYETLEACDQLDMLLGRLRRQRMLSDAEWIQSKSQVADIRARIEHHLEDGR
jgi:hypothetical protein